jgi:hypothetical protein
MSQFELAADFVAQPGLFNKEGERSMRKLILIGFSLGSLLMAGGCATPGYSAAERSQLIQRDFDYNGGQMIDDWDHVFMLRPASTLTLWNVQ